MWNGLEIQKTQCTYLVNQNIFLMTKKILTGHNPNEVNLVDKSYTNIELSISDTCSQSIAFVVIES